MARVKLQMPEKFGWSTDIPLRITDVNYGKHMGNDALVSLLHEARVQYLNHLGYTEFSLAGAALIQADLMVEYKSEVFYPDTLSIKIAAADFTSVGFSLYYHVWNKNGIEVAKAKTGMVCFNYDTRKLMPVPHEFVQKTKT